MRPIKGTGGMRPRGGQTRADQGWIKPGFLPAAQPAGLRMVRVVVVVVLVFVWSSISQINP